MKELNIQPELKRNCKQSSEGVLKQGWHIVSTQSCKGVFFLFLFFVGKIWGSKFFICNRLLHSGVLTVTLEKYFQSITILLQMFDFPLSFFISSFRILKEMVVKYWKFSMLSPQNEFLVSKLQKVRCKICCYANSLKIVTLSQCFK